MYILESKIGTVPRGYANKSVIIGIYCFIVHAYPLDSNSTPERSYYSLWWHIISLISVFPDNVTFCTIVFSSFGIKVEAVL